MSHLMQGPARLYLQDGVLPLAGESVWAIGMGLGVWRRSFIEGIPHVPYRDFGIQDGFVKS